MAAPNTNASDLDRADATLTLLVSHLNSFRQACETPSSNQSTHQGLQQLSISAVNKDLDKIRQDLDSIRARLESTAVRSEADAAERKEKQAILDRAILTAREREADAKKREERLGEAIMYAREKEAEADKKIAEAGRKEAEADKKMAEAEKMMKAAQQQSDAAVADQSKADSELAGMESMRASFDADFRQRSKRLQEEEKRTTDRGASLSSSEGRLATNQELHRKFELATEKRMEEAHALMKYAQDEREAAQRNLDTAVAIDHITSGAEGSADSNSMNELLKQVDECIRVIIDRLSSASTSVSLELAEVSVGMGELKTATQTARTLASDLVSIQRATMGKRPLSSHAEPTSKRARSVLSIVFMESELDTDPSPNVSSGRMIRSPRSRREASVTPGPSNQPLVLTHPDPGPSGPSNQPPMLPGPGPYGLIPGFGFCPATIRHAADKTQRTWAQIEFAAGWTDDDSAELLKEFNKHADKAVLRQTAQPSLDRCAGIAKEKCLVQDMKKVKPKWKQGEDAEVNECVQCAKKTHFCIWVEWSDANHGQYDENATSGKRWKVTKR